MSDLDPTPSGALKAIMDDHKAKVAAVEASKATIAEALSVIAPAAASSASSDEPVTAVPATTLTPGNKTSEGKRLLIQQWFGNAMAIAASILAVFEAQHPDNKTITAVAGVLAILGGFMGNQAASKHAETRTDQKAGSPS